MFNWGRDKRYEEVLLSIKQLQGDMQFLDAKMEAMKTNITSLRGLWNKKLSKQSDDDEEDEGDYVERLRKLFGGQLPIELQHLDKNKYQQTLS